MMIATTVTIFIFIGFSILFLTNNSVRISPSSSYTNQLNRSYPYYRQDLPILNFVSTDLLTLILLAAFLCGGDPDPDQWSGSGSVIQDLPGSWCIKGTGESTMIMDSPVPLMHHDPDRSWITDPDPDHPKGTQPLSLFAILRSSMSCREVGRVQSWLGDLS